MTGLTHRRPSALTGRQTLKRLDGLIEKAEKCLSKIPGAEFLDDFNVDEDRKEILRFTNRDGLFVEGIETGEIVRVRCLDVHKRVEVVNSIPAFFDEAIQANETAWGEVDEACNELEQALVTFEDQVSTLFDADA